MRAHYVLYTALAVLAGCGADRAPEVAGQPAATETREEKPGGVIPQHQLDALEKAKKVEGQLQEAAEKRADP